MEGWRYLVGWLWIRWDQNHTQPRKTHHPTPQAWVHHAQLTWQPAPTATTTIEPLPITLPLHATGPDDVLPSPSPPPSTTPPAPISALLRTFGPDGAARIYRALLHGQRLLFVGHGHAAAGVGRLVLAAAALLAPPLQGLLRRVYPYVTLSDLRFLETPGGFVAGTTNPVFARREGWWDLLCVLPPAAAGGGGGEGGGGKVGGWVSWSVVLLVEAWVVCRVCVHVCSYLHHPPSSPPPKHTKNTLQGSGAFGKGKCFAPGERDADDIHNTNNGGGGGGISSGSNSSRQQQRAPSPTTTTGGMSPFSLAALAAPLSPTRAATAPGGGGGGDGGDGGIGDGEAEAEAAMRARLKALAAGVGVGAEEGEEVLRAFFRGHGQVGGLVGYLRWWTD